VTFAIWSTVIGALLVAMAVFGSRLKRLPLSTAMLYVVVGFAIGPEGAGLLVLHPFDDAVFIEHAAEVAVLVSLFASGMKIKLPLNDPRWRLSARLALGSMLITVGLLTLLGVAVLGLSVGAAVLFGAILAPTDPVLASDVQLREPGDHDVLRFSLTSEAGLNDGTAFPFVMLGLGLLGLHDLGAGGWRWWAVDVIWAGVGGLAIGGGLGWLAGRTILYLRIRHREALGLDEFLTLGLIGLSYGVALLCHTYGFLAVFAAGLALQHTASESQQPAGSDGAAELTASEGETTAAADRKATSPQLGPQHMVGVVRGFTEQLERVLEVAVVLMVGAMLAYIFQAGRLLWVAAVLFVLIRPISVWLGLLGSATSRRQRTLMSWFGIRGIGCVYYLFYAINHGIDKDLAAQLLVLTLLIVTSSIVLHGVSVTPLMERYARRREKTSL
jgi:sodium/hydrogen antiporter